MPKQLSYSMRKDRAGIRGKAKGPPEGYCNDLRYGILEFRTWQENIPAFSSAVFFTVGHDGKLSG